MNTNDDKNTTHNATAKAKTICKLGLDVHAATIMVGRQVEGLNLQPPQKFKVADFLKWVQGGFGVAIPWLSTGFKVALMSL